MIESPLKNFLKTWVVPPGFIEARRSRVVPKIQKFWTGTELPAPPAETAFFASARLHARTITLDDDSRHCALIQTSARIPLPADSSGETVQTALAAAAAWPVNATIRLTVGSRTTAHSGLDAGKWLDIRLDVPTGATHLDVSSDAPVFFAAPRAVRVSAAAPRHHARHVVVLVIDAWTPRLTSSVHPTEPDTPLTSNIDRFFSDGFRAPHGYASGEWTMPTAASFFTGLCTARHRVFHPYAETTLPPGRPLLAEQFQQAGYHTVAMSVANRLTPAYGHHRGFDRFVYHFPEPGFTKRRYDTAVWIADLIGHLDAHRRDRAFAYVHLPDVHPVWEIPPLTRAFNLGRRGSSTGMRLTDLRKAPDAAEQGRQLYSLRLRELDRQLGTLFDYIDRTAPSETLVVLTSDHGTPWHYLRSRRPKDEPFLVDDRTAVSFFMRGAGVPRATVDGLSAPTLDLMPTVLAHAGLPVPSEIDGRNLLDPSYRRSHVISESIYRGVYEIAVRDARRTFIERYPVDERAVRVTGPAAYSGLFETGTSDYGALLPDDPGTLRDAAHAHIDQYLRGAAE